jgi:hypothetical protein
MVYDPAQRENGRPLLLLLIGGRFPARRAPADERDEGLAS